MATEVFFTSWDVAEQLKQLGLIKEILHRAASAGQAARASCTDNDPALLPGLLSWARTTRAFREETIPLGWRRSEDQLSATTHPSLKFSVVVATGDEGTGIAGPEPSTKHPRGPATVSAVVRNQLSLGLFGDENMPEGVTKLQPVTSGEFTTWLFLIHPTEEEIRMELSLPTSIGADGRVDQWNKRIILPPLKLNPDPGGNKKTDVQSDDIDVPVQRKNK